MDDRVSWVSTSFSKTVDGFVVKVTYTTYGSPHVWLYVEARRLTRAEALELLETLNGVLVPGELEPAVAAQLSLELG